MNSFKIRCDDGIEIASYSLLSETPKAAIIMAAATATPKEFYTSFGKHLQKQGFHFYAYDYRGIFGSKSAEGLKNSDIEYLDWAKYDMKAVIDFVHEAHPDLKIIQIGHSVGGQMIGLIPNNHLLTALVTFAFSSGYIWDMKAKYIPQAALFFYVLRPIGNLFWGYGKFKWLGIMEDLPTKLVNDWYHWCSVPEYFFHPKFINQIVGHSYDALPMPIHVFWTEDDDISNEKNIHNFWKNIKSPHKLQKLIPADFGLKEIGHFGFFKKKYEATLWPLMLEKIKSYL